MPKKTTTVEFSSEEINRLLSEQAKYEAGADEKASVSLQFEGHASCEGRGAVTSLVCKATISEATAAAHKRKRGG